MQQNGEVLNCTQRSSSSLSSCGPVFFLNLGLTIMLSIQKTQGSKGSALFVFWRKTQTIPGPGEAINQTEQDKTKRAQVDQALK